MNKKLIVSGLTVASFLMGAASVDASTNQVERIDNAPISFSEHGKDHKCGAGKCGAKDEKKDDSSEDENKKKKDGEAKCGEGTCGS